jgi:hypothetical protein
VLPRKIDKLTIVGLGKSVYDWVNYQWLNFEPEQEIWTINAGATVFRHDIVFDMHSERWIAEMDEATLIRVMRRRSWLKSHDKPIYMPKAMPEFPTSVTYPLEDVIQKTGSCYFSTGIAYMLAMALCCGVKQLMLWGCDFSYDRNSNSHDEQGRACAEYWVGRLVGAGCHVGSSPGSHFMDGHRRSQGKIYGYDEPVAPFVLKG